MAAPTVIFGAHGGIGEALARRLAAASRELVLVGRREETMAALGRELGAGHGVCDVLDPASIEAALERADAGDGLAGLAYCVGSIDLKPLKQATAEDFLQSFMLNCVGAALAVKAAAPALDRAGGSVVLFSTVAVSQGFPNHSIIAAAKGAVEGLMRSLAAELAPTVRVNAVAPSLTRTPLAAQLTRSETMTRSVAGLHALPRLGEAQDMAAAAAYLLGEESAWVTGQVLHVDGGRSRLRTKG